MDLNSVSITGRFTRDVELRHTPSNMAVADISLAVNDSKKNGSGDYEEVVHFVDVTLFGRTAEVAAEYCSKGSRVAVEGRLCQDRWEDKEGNKRSKIKVMANKFVMLGSKGDSPGGGQPQQQAPASNQYEDSEVPF